MPRTNKKFSTLPCLTEKDILNYATAFSACADCEHVILRRLFAIETAISHTFNVTINGFAFPNASKDYVGTFHSALDDVGNPEELINWQLICDPEVVLNYVDNNGKTWKLNECFPYNWLFTDFEKELKTGAQITTAQSSIDLIKIKHVGWNDIKAELDTTGIYELTGDELSCLYRTVVKVLTQVTNHIDDRKRAN